MQLMLLGNRLMSLDEVSDPWLCGKRSLESTNHQHANFGAWERLDCSLDCRAGRVFEARRFGRRRIGGPPKNHPPPPRTPLTRSAVEGNPPVPQHTQAPS